MPTFTRRHPSHCHHKASNRGVVRLDGRDYYTGTRGPKSSKAEYDRLIARWLSGELTDTTSDITVGEVADEYWDFVQRHYVKNGLPTDEQTCIRCELRPLLAVYESERADSFGPKALAAVRDRMIESGQCRGTVNSNSCPECPRLAKLHIH